MAEVESRKLHIDNLHYEIGERQLRELFERIGPTIKCSVKKDRTGRSKERGVVVYEKLEDAIRAKKEYHNANAKGQPLQIAFAPEKVFPEGIKIAGSARNPSQSDFSTNLLDRIGSSSGSLFDRLNAKESYTSKRPRPPANAPKGPAAERIGPNVPREPRADRLNGSRSPVIDRYSSSRGPRSPRAAVSDRSRSRRSERSQPTSNSLDAELDAFMNSKNEQDVQMAL